MSAGRGTARARLGSKQQINKPNMCVFSWGLWLGTGNPSFLVSGEENEKPLRTGRFVPERAVGGPAMLLGEAERTLWDGKLIT